MATDNSRNDGFFNLRKRAELWLSGSEQYPSSPLTLEETHKLVHELHTHQIELELQNEDLRFAQQGLEESRRKYTDLYEFAPVGYLTIDANGLIEECNMTALAMLGFTRHQVLGHSFTQYIQHDSQDVYSHFRKRLLISSKKQRCELSLVKEDTSVFYALLESRVRLDIDGNVGNLWLTMSDISDRKALEDSLKESKKEWEQTFDSISDSIALLDSDLRIVKANKATSVIISEKAENLIGKHCFEIFGGNAAVCPGCQGAQSFQDFSTHSAEILNEKLGKIFQITCFPVRQETNRVSHIVHIARDITEQKKSEAERLQSQKMEAIGTLAGGIAHDFNNILTTILGYGQIVHETMSVADPARAHIDHIINAANHAQKLIGQILTFGRKGPGFKSLLTLAPVVKEALNLVRASAPSRIKIVERLDPESGSLLADRTQIHQVVINLCTNAIYAMEGQQGVLTVQVREVMLKDKEVTGLAENPSGPFLELMVKDTGCGIDKKTQKQMFESYFTTKGFDRGSGLGLAIVQEIVTSCGGTINCESEPGRGATFRVYFPIFQEQDCMPVKIPEAVPATDDKELLIVDPDKAIIEVYTIYLEAIGYTVKGFCHIEKALEYIQAFPNKVKLITVDQGTPNLLEREFIAEVLKIRPDLPVILYTDQYGLVAEKRAGIQGVRRCLTKPASSSELAFSVKKVLEEAEALRNNPAAG